MVLSAAGGNFPICRLYTQSKINKHKTSSSEDEECPEQESKNTSTASRTSNWRALGSSLTPQKATVRWSDPFKDGGMGSEEQRDFKVTQQRGREWDGTGALVLQPQVWPPCPGFPGSQECTYGLNRGLGRGE